MPRCTQAKFPFYFVVEISDGDSGHDVTIMFEVIDVNDFIDIKHGDLFNAPAGAFNSRSEFNLPKANSTIVPFLGNLYRRNV